MGVVFDEVIANVEAPRPVVSDSEREMPQQQGDDEELKLQQMLETQQRRQRRLHAD